MKMNDVTFFVGIFFLPIWLIWEIVVLKLHGGDHSVGTISMVMRERAYQMNSLPLFWAGMCAHWWVNWIKHPVYETPYPAIAFWLIVAGTLIADISLWHTPYGSLGSFWKGFRAPPIQAALGFLAAYSLFPQRALQGPYRWW